MKKIVCLLALMFFNSCGYTNEDEMNSMCADKFGAAACGIVSPYSSETQSSCKDGESNSMKDAAGNSYPTVCINNQFWMAKNMAYQKDVTCYAKYYEKQYSSVEVDCKNEAECIAKYGCLYLQDDATKICPSGWHLPSYNEFNDLLEYLGSDAKKASKKLRAKSFSDGNNETGFSALPAGSAYGNYYRDFGTIANFWSSSKGGSYLYITDSSAIMEATSVNYFFSVRCIKD